MFEDLIPDLQPFAREFVQELGAAGFQPRITSTRRSSSEQARLYRRFQQGLSRYPVKPPGTSAHEFGFAFDLVTQPMSLLPEAGAYWKSWGGLWYPSDEVHFEYPGFVPPAESAPSLFDYVGTALSFTGLWSTVLELGYIALSQEEAIKIAKMLHVDPYGRIF